MTPQRSDSEQARTAAQEQARAAVVRFIPDSWDRETVANFLWRLDDYAHAIEAEAGAASPAEPLQRLHRAVADLPVHMGHGAIRAIEVLELIEAEQRAALAAPSQERASEPAGLDVLENFAESGYCPGCKVAIDLHPLDAEGVDVGRCPSPREAVDALYARLTASAAAQERP